MPHTLHGNAARARAFRRMAKLALAALLSLAGLAVSARTTLAQTPGSPDLVISQVYTRGGESGAAFRNDYVEIFNRGNTPINLADYSVQVLVVAQPQPGFPGGLTSLTTRFVSSGGSVPLEPGRYRLLAYGSSGNNGAPLPGVFFPMADFNMPSTFGRVSIVRGMAPLGQFGCPVGTDASLVDFFSYGTAICAEGPALFAAPTQTTAAFRNSGGCTDTDSNVADFAAAAANPSTDQTPAAPCNLTAPTSTMQFEVATTSVNENAGTVEIFVTRAGDTTGAASVQYATSNDITIATDRRDYTTTFGALSFAAGETRKSFRILIADDVRAESSPPEVFFVGLANPTGAALGAQHITKVNINDDDAGGAPNPIDTTDFFVRQHYADFLSRVPDDAGRTFWSNEIDNCGADEQCREVKRINVSAAFFLSIEFQQSGFLVYRFYQAAFPENAAERPRSFPRYRELWRDTQQIGRDVIVGQTGWPEKLEANKQAYAAEFVTRPEFLLVYPTTQTPEQFVDALNANAGGVLSQAERDQQVAELTAAGNTNAGRASVLRRVAEDEDLRNAEFNKAFVLMQYIGYLRRGPDDPPDTGFGGYDFWLSKLNEFNGNFIQAEMVKAFLDSIEYRTRFAP